LAGAIPRAIGVRGDGRVALNVAFKHLTQDAALLILQVIWSPNLRDHGLALFSNFDLKGTLVSGLSFICVSTVAGVEPTLAPSPLACLQSDLGFEKLRD
jgi:hypothetical protein